MSDEQNAQNSYTNSQKSAAKTDVKLLAYKNEDISNETQEMLNKPIDHPEELDPKDVEFLAMLMDKIDKGEIDLYRPATLLNHPVYDKLSKEDQGKADLEAFNLLSTIREISKLWNLEHRHTYQIENLTHRIRVTKERLEALGGDIYII